MNLVKPTKKYADCWADALLEFETESITGFWDIPEKPKNIDEYIPRVEAQSQGKKSAGWSVPVTTYWLIDKDKFIGHANIRHHLNEKLKKIGGHIGYAIRPTERAKGYGNNILKLAIPKAKELSLLKLLITCDNTNVASQKIIMNNGGKLLDTIQVDGKMIERYWINIESRET